MNATRVLFVGAGAAAALFDQQRAVGPIDYGTPIGAVALGALAGLAMSLIFDAAVSSAGDNAQIPTGMPPIKTGQQVQV